MRSRRTARDKIIWVVLSWNYVESICHLGYFILKEILKEDSLSFIEFVVRNWVLLFDILYDKLKLNLRL